MSTSTNVKNGLETIQEVINQYAIINQAEVTTQETSTETSTTAAETINEETTQPTTQEQANSLLNELNTAIKEKAIARSLEIKGRLEEVITTLNAEERAEQTQAILNGNEPILNAFKIGIFTLSKLSENKKTGFYSIGEKLEIIDIQDIVKDAPKFLFNDKNALFYIEALNHAIFDYVSERLAIVKKSKRLKDFEISATAQALEVTAEQMKTVEGITQALQRVSTSIIDGLKITSIEAEALLFNYAKWGRNITGVSLATEANFRRMLTRVLYKVLNNEEFSAE